MKKKKITEQTEPYQRAVRSKHRKMKVRLIGLGKNKKAEKGWHEADYGRSKSAPAPPIGERKEAKGLLREQITKGKLWNLLSKAASGAVVDFNPIGGIKVPYKSLVGTVSVTLRKIKKVSSNEYIGYGPTTLSLDQAKARELVNNLSSPTIQKVNSNVNRIKVVTGGKTATLAQYLSGVTAVPGAVKPPVAAKAAKKKKSEKQKKKNQKLLKDLSKLKQKSDKIGQKKPQNEKEAKKQAKENKALYAELEKIYKDTSPEVKKAVKAAATKVPPGLKWLDTMFNVLVAALTGKISKLSKTSKQAAPAAIAAAAISPVAKYTGALSLHYPLDISTGHCIGDRFGRIPRKPTKRNPKPDRNHRGVDMGGKKGDPVYASHDGTVINAEFGVNGGQKFYGYTIIIQSLDGKYFTLYAHLSQMNVENTQRVKAGQKIGAVGDTGCGDCPNHLHYEFRYGRNSRGAARDPVPYFDSIPKCKHGVYYRDNPRIDKPKPIVTKQKGLSLADSIQKYNLIKVDGKYMAKPMAIAWVKMRDAAAKDDIKLVPGSAFRTYASQERLYKCYLDGLAKIRRWGKTRKDFPNWSSFKEAREKVRRTGTCNNGNGAGKPGNGAHQRGIAVDISVGCRFKLDNRKPGPKCLEQSAVYRWLVANAKRYGFKQMYTTEAWHWQYKP